MKAMMKEPRMLADIRRERTLAEAIDAIDGLEERATTPAFLLGLHAAKNVVTSLYDVEPPELQEEWLPKLVRLQATATALGERRSDDRAHYMYVGGDWWTEYPREDKLGG